MYPISLIERFWRKVDKNGPVPATRPDLGPCWLWLGYKSWDGYGEITWHDRISRKSRKTQAHQFSWNLVKEPIKRPLVSDHLCKVRHCVNPDHIEAVTNRVNVVVRGTGITALNAVKTKCLRGHEFTPKNTIIDKRGRRSCRRCAVEFLRKRWKYRRENGICLNCKEPNDGVHVHCHKHWLWYRNNRLNKAI